MRNDADDVARPAHGAVRFRPPNRGAPDAHLRGALRSAVPAGAGRPSARISRRRCSVWKHSARSLRRKRLGLLITPIGARPANAKLDVGESGSTLRFLLPVLGALGVQAEIQMHGRLPERPLSPLWEVLEAHGMQLRQDGAVLHTDGQLCEGDYSLPGNVSSQFISGLLFALPLLSGNSTLTVTGALQSARYVSMTEQALAAAGIFTKKDGQVWQIGGEQRYAAPAVQTVEGDCRTRRFSFAWARCLRQA